MLTLFGLEASQMLKLSQLIDAGHVALDVASPDVPDLLNQLVKLLVSSDELSEASAKALAEALLRREQLGSTSIGRGVAVPHAYVVDLPTPTMLVARLERPIAYGEPEDGRPVDLVFLLIGPESARPKHARVLARIVRLMHDQAWLEALREASSPEAVVEAIHDVERRHA